MTGTNAKIYAINDPSVQTKYSNTPVSKISVEEFLEDFGHYAKAIWSGKPKDRFTPEEREYLDKMKSLAVDVEYEEIQG